ncbi:endonuclease-reverse transcriptase [Elysia marginata]|uniref:Endonuclease-reverse transcriptase n=1 Tax=Elysia marginata TaxID=1093978 RepID=A0AAV4EYY4_9GAST|nr:endonuclease-reverse transcriptase [Elysia marginata]
MKCFVWSPFPYASETCTLNKNTEKRIEAMEMWIYRRMQRISWNEKVTNKKVLESVGLQRPELLLTIQRRKMKYYGHLRRHDSIQKRILEGKIDGRRGRGRRRQTWLGNIQETSQMKMGRKVGKGSIKCWDIKQAQLPLGRLCHKCVKCVRRPWTDEDGAP